MNEAVFYFFYNFAYQAVWLDKAIIFLAVYFPFVVMLLAFLYLLFYKKSLRESLLVFFSVGVAWIVAHVLKILISGSRPFNALPGVTSLFVQDGHAFPSGHATFFATLAVAIFFINKKAGYVFMFFALLIGFARIASGVHFPIDILGGFALGVLVAYLFKKYRIALQ